MRNDVLQTDKKHIHNIRMVKASASPTNGGGHGERREINLGIAVRQSL